MKRYSIGVSEGGLLVLATPNPDGNWVRYADVEAALERLVEEWRTVGAAFDRTHATMGLGYHACADHLDALLRRAQDA
jgi:hypothetical protein